MSFFITYYGLLAYLKLVCLHLWCNIVLPDSFPNVAATRFGVKCIMVMESRRNIQESAGHHGKIAVTYVTVRGRP